MDKQDWKRGFCAASQTAYNGCYLWYTVLDPVKLKFLSNHGQAAVGVEIALPARLRHALKKSPW